MTNRAVQTLTPAELSARWGLSVGTLANWRSSGRGPAFSKIGGIRYSMADVVAFERRSRVRPRYHRARGRRR